MAECSTFKEGLLRKNSKPSVGSKGEREENEEELAQAGSRSTLTFSNLAAASAASWRARFACKSSHWHVTPRPRPNPSLGRTLTGEASLAATPPWNIIGAPVGQWRLAGAVRSAQTLGLGARHQLEPSQLCQQERFPACGSSRAGARQWVDRSVSGQPVSTRIVVLAGT